MARRQRTKLALDCLARVIVLAAGSWRQRFEKGWRSSSMRVCWRRMTWTCGARTPCLQKLLQLLSSVLSTFLSVPASQHSSSFICGGCALLSSVLNMLLSASSSQCFLLFTRWWGLSFFYFSWSLLELAQVCHGLRLPQWGPAGLPTCWCWIAWVNACWQLAAGQGAYTDLAHDANALERVLQHFPILSHYTRKTMTISKLRGRMCRLPMCIMLHHCHKMYARTSRPRAGAAFPRLACPCECCHVA